MPSLERGPMPGKGECCSSYGRARGDNWRPCEGDGDNRSCPCGKKFDGLVSLTDHVWVEHNVCPFSNCDFETRSKRCTQRVTLAIHVNKHAAQEHYLDVKYIRQELCGHKPVNNVAIRKRRPEDKERMKKYHKESEYQKTERRRAHQEEMEWKAKQRAIRRREDPVNVMATSKYAKSK